MKVYHGTSEKVARLALTKGLLPRSLTNHIGNWKHTVQSSEDKVYLTDIYAPYFANCATEDGEKWGIVEINLDLLDRRNLYPDEDFLAQYFRLPELPKDIMKRTNWFKERIEDYKKYWVQSLTSLGTVAHAGSVPARAITRISIFDPESCPPMAIYACDPTITIENAAFCHKKYWTATRWFMGDKVEPEDLIEFSAALKQLLPPKQFEEMLDNAKWICEHRHVEILTARKENS